MGSELSPEAESYLRRLRDWARNYPTREEKVSAYWTQARRKEHGEKVRANMTPERRRALSIAGSKGASRDKPFNRVVPDLPDDTLVWRSTNQSSVYHLDEKCPAVGSQGDLNRGRLGAMKAIGRVLCYYESFHWKKGGA